jgi:glutamine amidotransferase-like uncharacterized protein
MNTGEIKKYNLIVTFLIVTVLISSSIPADATKERTQEATMNDQCYGFLINVTDNQLYGLQTNITRLLNTLLHFNVSIYWITHDITLSAQGLDEASTVADHSFKKGCFIIAFGNDTLMNTKITEQVYQKWLVSRVGTYKIMQPLENFSAYHLLEPRIACYNGTSVDSFFFPYQLAYAGFDHVDIITSKQLISNLTVDNYDVFIWGGQFGTYFETLSDILSSTGLQVRKTIRNYIKTGGNYIGACYGGWRAASGYHRPLGFPLDLGYSSLLSLLPIQLDLLDYNVYRALPGAGPVNLTIKNLDHPLTFGLPENISNIYYFGGPMFLNKRGTQPETETIAVLSDVDMNWWEFDFMMNFAPWWNNKILSNETKYRIANQWINDSIGSAMWVTGMFGKGKVIAFGLHPEYCFAFDGEEDRSSPPRVMFNSMWYATGEGPFATVLDIPVTFSNLTVDAGGPYTTAVDQLIQFNGSVLTGTSPYNWLWEFELSDYFNYYSYPYNNTREEQNPWFGYSQRGKYQVTLVVTDASGNIGYDITTVRVN